MPTNTHLCGLADSKQMQTMIRASVMRVFDINIEMRGPDEVDPVYIYKSGGESCDFARPQSTHICIYLRR